MTRVLCQGYCGAYHDRFDMVQVGRDGERMCTDCARKARNH